MERMTKIQIWLSGEEFEALRDRALREFRHPRDEARRIIRRDLMGDIPIILAQKNTSAVIDRPHAGVTQ